MPTTYNVSVDEALKHLPLKKKAFHLHSLLEHPGTFCEEQQGRTKSICGDFVILLCL